MATPHYTQPSALDSNPAPPYYAAVFASLPTVLLVLAPPAGERAPTIVDCNPAACAATGYTREELLGQPVSLISATPLDVEERRVGLEQMRRGEAWGFASLRRHRDGTVTRITVQCSLMSYAGQELIVSVEQNELDPAEPLPAAGPLSEHEPIEQRLRASEERLRLAMSAGHMGIWELDLVNNQLVWGAEHDNALNEVSVRRSRPVEESLGFVHPDDRGRLFRQLRAAMSGKGRFHIEYRVLDEDGGERWMEARGRFVPDEAGRPTRAIGVALDIQERKELEAALARQARHQEALAGCLRALLIPGHDSVARRAILAEAIASLQHGLEPALVAIGTFEEGAGHEEQLRLVTLSGAGGAAAPGAEQQRLIAWGALDTAEQQTLQLGLPTVTPRSLFGERGRASEQGTTHIFPIFTREGLWGCLLIELQAGRELGALERSLVETAVEMIRIAIRRWLALDALTASEERLRLALEGAKLGLWEWNLVSDQVVWSEQNARLFGRTLDQGDASSQTFVDSIHPDDIAAVNEATAQAISTRQPTRYAFRITRPDGEMRWLEALGQAFFDEAGLPLRMVGIMLDITERRRAADELAALNAELEHRVRERTLDLELANRALRNEIEDRERAEASLAVLLQQLTRLNEDLGRSSLLLSTIVDSLDDGLALIDRDGKVLMANQALARLYHTNLEQILGQPWGTICSVTPPLLARTLERGGPVAGQERLLRPDGSAIVVELRAFPLVGVGGAAEQVVLHLMDITERLQFEAVAIQNERLAASSRLAAIVAHEVNSPLQAIQNLLYLAASDNATERANNLSLIAEEIDRIGGLLHRLLDLNRPGDTTYRPNSINGLVEKVLTLTGTTMARHQVAVRRELAADLPLVLGRGDHLTQVLLNLVLNALDAMPRGGSLCVRTEARAHRADDALPGPPPRWVVTVEVHDSGDGIPGAALPYIFEPFFTTKADGSGLGLAISSQIVEQHGGRLRARNAEPSGAVFTIVLPAFSGSEEE